ncbi:Ig-like domain-containing protein, partial [Acinetobacter rongchengensis]
VEIGTAIVDSTGNWSFTPSTDLAEGAHAIAISQKDAAGNESPKTTPVNFTVDSVPPTAAPTLDNINDDVAPVTGSIGEGDTTNDVRPELTGTGEAGNSISIYDNG